MQIAGSKLIEAQKITDEAAFRCLADPSKIPG